MQEKRCCRPPKFVACKERLRVHRAVLRKPSWPFLLGAKYSEYNQAPHHRREDDGFSRRRRSHRVARWPARTFMVVEGYLSSDGIEISGLDQQAITSSRRNQPIRNPHRKDY